MGEWRLSPPKHAAKVPDGVAVHLLNDRLRDNELDVRMMKYYDGWYVIPNKPEDHDIVVSAIATHDPKEPTKAQLEEKAKADKRKAALDKLKAKLGLDDEEWDALTNK